MGLLDYLDPDAHSKVSDAGHKAELSHELIAAAAAYEGAKAYEKHTAANGKPASHPEAKKLLAAGVGLFVDRLVESKGLDYIDKQKAKHAAEKHAEEALQKSGDYS